MIIGGKSAIDLNQLQDRYKKNVKYLELHTEYSDFSDANKKYFLSQFLSNSDIQCYAVHSPMHSPLGECALGVVNKKQREMNLELFKKSIDLANEVCTYFNPIVIIHIYGGYLIEENNKINKDFEVNKQIKAIKEDLNFLNNYIEKNKMNIVIAIENHTSLSTSKKGELKSSYYGLGFDVPEIVRELNLKNVGTTLDICHAQSVCNFDIINYYQHGMKTRTIVDFIKGYSDTIKLIHLSKVKDFGEVVHKHGLPFLPIEEDISYLERIFKALKEINYNNPITVETMEENYNDAINYELTYSTIKEYVLSGLHK